MRTFSNGREKSGKRKGGDAQVNGEPRQTIHEFVESAREISYGVLALKPAEFWALTPGEFLELCYGYNERARERGARLALLVNAHLYAKPIAAQDLMPPERKKKAKTEKTAEQKRREYEKMKVRLRE